MPPALRDLLLMKTFNLSYTELNSIPATDLEAMERTAWARVDYFYERLSQATDKGAFGFIADALYLLVVERLL